MENIASVIQSIASLAWPLIVVIVLLGFRTKISELFETAKSRKFTVKVAGNELTMEEVSQQQASLIADLQDQLGELQQVVKGLAQEQNPSADKNQATPAQRYPKLPRLILWVDDKPKGNSFIIQNLQDQGTQVITAVSTREALERLGNAKFDCVITDMGRFEEGRFNAIAGLQLIEAIRETYSSIPIFVFTSTRSLVEREAELIAAGATGVSASANKLINMLQGQI